MAYPPSRSSRFSSPLDAFDYQRLATSERTLEDGQAAEVDASRSINIRLPRLKYVLVGASLLLGLHWIALWSSPTYAAYASLEAISLRNGLGSDGTPLSWLASSKAGGAGAGQKIGMGDVIEEDPLVGFWDPQLNAINATNKARAAFVILARNIDTWDIIASIRQMEDRFNHKYHYPYVFLNEVPFTEAFKRHTSAIASGTCSYGLIPKDQWGEEPAWIDQDKATKARQAMVEKKIIYGGSVSYRRMCRYQSGFFWRHPLLDDYDYYWRIEPSVKYFCDLDYDPFVFMRDNNKKYGWTVSIFEYAETIPTLWSETQAFIHANQHYVADNNLIDWISDDKGMTYNRCHFWSNFEIGDLNFFRSDAYRAYFDHLDRAGGFFYERWGDAPVHSIAAALFLNRSEVHFFRDIGYRHEPFQHCPAEPQDKDRCACNPEDSFENHWYSCTKKWKEVNP